jgi:hypothetical protein
MARYSWRPGAGRGVVIGYADKQQWPTGCRWSLLFFFEVRIGLAYSPVFPEDSDPRRLQHQSRSGVLRVFNQLGHGRASGGFGNLPLRRFHHAVPAERWTPYGTEQAADAFHTVAIRPCTGPVFPNNARNSMAETYTRGNVTAGAYRQRPRVAWLCPQAHPLVQGAGLGYGSIVVAAGLAKRRRFAVGWVQGGRFFPEDLAAALPAHLARA